MRSEAAGGPHVQPADDQRPAPARSGVALMLLLLAALTVALLPPASAHAEVGHRRDTPPPSAAAPVPVLAYYYIWFNPTSWNRAKIDYPLLGRYSSDDREVMRQHVRMGEERRHQRVPRQLEGHPAARPPAAQLDRRGPAGELQAGIVYQGLDFDRIPLPVDTVAADLTLRDAVTPTDPVFYIFGKPLVDLVRHRAFTAAQIGR